MVKPRVPCAMPNDPHVLLLPIRPWPSPATEESFSQMTLSIFAGVNPRKLLNHSYVKMLEELCFSSCLSCSQVVVAIQNCCQNIDELEECPSVVDYVGGLSAWRSIVKTFYVSPQVSCTKQTCFTLIAFVFFEIFMHTFYMSLEIF